MRTSRSDCETWIRNLFAYVVLCVSLRMGLLITLRLLTLIACLCAAISHATFTSSRNSSEPMTLWSTRAPATRGYVAVGRTAALDFGHAVLAGSYVLRVLSCRIVHKPAPAGATQTSLALALWIVDFVKRAKASGGAKASSGTKA